MFKQHSNSVTIQSRDLSVASILKILRTQVGLSLSVLLFLVGAYLSFNTWFVHQPTIEDIVEDSMTGQEETVVKPTAKDLNPSSLNAYTDDVNSDNQQLNTVLVDQSGEDTLIERSNPVVAQNNTTSSAVKESQDINQPSAASSQNKPRPIAAATNDNGESPNSNQEQSPLVEVVDVVYELADNSLSQASDLTDEIFRVVGL